MNLISAAMAVVSGAARAAADAAVGVPMEICPKAPPGAQVYVNDISGYVVWGVISLFGVGVVVSVGLIVAGRIFNMPHATKSGVVGIFVVFLAVLAYLIAPGIVTDMLGGGCVR